MAIPSTFSPVLPQDFTLTPVKVYKQFVLSGSEFQTTSSGYTLLEGYYSSKKTPIGTTFAANDPINTINGSYKHIIWHHVDHMYYKFPHDQYRTHEHHSRRFSSKFLDVTCSYLSIPYMDYGERIVKESVVISNSTLGITLQDDGYGNLYDISKQSDLFSSSYMDRRYLLGYFGFNDLFKNFKYHYGDIENGEGHYESYNFSPDKTYKIKNTAFSAGVTISGSGTGLAAEFDGSGGCIQIHNRNEFNFDSIEPYTISFYVYVDGNGSGSIISKRGTIFADTFGVQPKVLASGQITNDKHISSSFISKDTSVYPFDFRQSGSSIIYSRSDGIHTINLSGSLVTGSWNHISAVRHMYGEVGTCALFVNDQFKQQATDGTLSPLNDYEIILGAKNLVGDNSFTGKIDELRFYKSSFITGSNISGSTFHTNLYNTRYLYNTSAVGNVFYRRGNIVISSMDPTYNNMLSGSNWSLSYRGTHTIYEYSCYVRIKKGDFNLTMNPTARKSPKSDLLINDMIGSLLNPYYTTIGLYNTKGDLLVIGKLGQPVEMRNDVDVNWRIQWDG